MNIKNAIDRMAEAGAKSSLPRDGMFNSEQLDVMKCERLPKYREVAEIMLEALLEAKP